MKNVLKSRKFYAALVSLVIIFAGDRAGVSYDALLLAVATLATYIGGVALEDGLSAK